MVLKRPASVKSAAWKKVPYVRGARRVPARGVRREHGQWKRNVAQLLSFSKCPDRQVKAFIANKLLPDWAGKVCPKCNQGILSSLKVHCGEIQMLPQKLPAKRSSLLLASYLPSLSSTRRTFPPSAICYALVATSPCVLGLYPHRLGHQPQSRGEYATALGRSSLEKKEKGIVFAKSKGWTDVQGDEVTFDKRDVSQDPNFNQQVEGDKCLLWWCGLVQRASRTLLSSLA